MGKKAPFTRGFIPVTLIFLTILSSACSGRTQMPQVDPGATATLPPTQAATASAPPAAAPSPTVTATAPLSREINQDNADQITPPDTIGKGSLLKGPVYSSDGHWLAVPTASAVYLLDAGTQQEKWVLPVIAPELAFSKDGKLVATSASNALSLYSTGDGSLLRSLDSQKDRLYTALAFSPDNRLIAASDYAEDTSIVWLIADGSRLHTLTGWDVSFSPDGKRAVTHDGSKKVIYLYDLQSGSKQNQWIGERAGFLADGRMWIESGGAVRMMDLAKDLATGPFEGQQAVFSTDGKELAVFFNSKILVYEVATGRMRAILEGTFTSLDMMQFSPDGQTIAAATMAPQCEGCNSQVQPLAAWRTSDGKRIASLDKIGYANAFAFAPDGKTLTVAKTERLELWQVADGSLSATLDGFYARAAGMALAADGTTLAVVYDSSPYTIRFWDLRDHHLIYQVQHPQDSSAILNIQVNFSPDGQMLIAGGDIWRKAGQGQWKLANPTDPSTPTFWPSSNAISPSGDTFVTGYQDGSVLFWKLQDGSIQDVLEKMQGNVLYLAYALDGKSLATISSDPPESKLQIWQMPEKKRLKSMTNPQFLRLAFSQDGQTLATLAAGKAYADYGQPAGPVQLWKVTGNDPALTLALDDAMSIAFSPDGTLLATGSYDGTIRLWNAANGQLVATRPSGQRMINHLLFTPDGSRLVCATANGTLIIWGLPDR